MRLVPKLMCSRLVAVFAAWERRVARLNPRPIVPLQHSCPGVRRRRAASHLKRLPLNRLNPKKHSKGCVWLVYLYSVEYVQCSSSEIGTVGWYSTVLYLM